MPRVLNTQSPQTKPPQEVAAMMARLRHEAAMKSAQGQASQAGAPIPDVYRAQASELVHNWNTFLQGGHLAQEVPTPHEAMQQGYVPGYHETAQQDLQSMQKPLGRPMQAPVGTSKTPLEQMQRVLQRVQEMVGGLVGDPEAMRDMAEVLGPHACFEDVLAYVMMKIARSQERNVMERIQMLENGGHPGLKGWLSYKAADLGGMAGGVVGAIQGGAAGAAVGQDVGKRLMNQFTGYNSEDSRQIQFEKLKQEINKLNEMMTCISNAIATMHSTAKNTIGNIRA